MSESDFERGFQKGFEKGLAEGKKLSQPQIGWPSTSPDFGAKDKCPKCGITIGGMMNYTCSSINCPTFYQATSFGAVGSSSEYTWSTTGVGANGPAPTLKEEEDRLNRSNEVWINGTWASLGN